MNYDDPEQLRTALCDTGDKLADTMEERDRLYEENADLRLALRKVINDFDTDDILTVARAINEGKHQERKRSLRVLQKRP